MSLDLDPRQRAMLQEMGIPVWWPAAAHALTAPPEAPSPAPSDAPHLTAPHNPSSAPPRTAIMAPQMAGTPARTEPPQPPATSPATAGVGGATAAPPSPWSLRAPQQLFPQADPAHTPANLGASWLLVAEDTGGSDPFADEAGRLLHNMLQALRLHRHPQVFFCALQAPGSTDPASAPVTGTANGADALVSAMAAVQPNVVLVMGRVAARAVLGRSEPLGQLRATPHTVAGVPAVVTYDAPYLLRAPPATKALVWADLCRARALAAGDDTPTAA